MAFGYKEAFGLKDNPFGPRRRVDALPPNLTAELETKPLLLHRHDDLEQLYCDKISSFRVACKNLETLLDADGYTTTSRGEGVSSYLIAIEGDSGAGKTTLACRMLQLMLKRYPNDEPAYGVEEVLLNSTTETATEQSEKLKALEATTGTPKAAYRCILVDDLLAEAYPDAIKLYSDLRNEAAILMVFTSRDKEMAAVLDKSMQRMQRYKIAPLTPDDAVAYVNLRYQRFRVPTTNGLNAEPLFPFDEQDIRTAVEVRVLKGAATTGPVTLRLVSSVLNSALTNQLQAIAREKPGFDATTLSPAELRALKIKVAQAYKVVVRK